MLIKNIFIIFVTLLLLGDIAFASDKAYIKNNKGQNIGYTKTYSNGTTVQYNNKGQKVASYKTNGNTITKYSKTGYREGRYN